MFIYRAIARTESFVKGLLFDCHACGQCVLSATGYICPMSCPKGLRNGPCGGTLGERCEVLPDRPCVWVRIHSRTGKGSFSVPRLLASTDTSLAFTSSALNFFSGRDRETRLPVPYLSLPDNRVDEPVQTGSALEAKLKAGRFVRTCEIRSPREGGLSTIRKQSEIVRDAFDAVNATAFLNGHPSLPSAAAAAEIARLGLEPISQATCRDHTRTSFISELIQNRTAGVHNTLCLTGDAFAGTPTPKQVFDMDAALMVYQARHLREKGTIQFTGETLKRPPRPFIGVAINPFTRPLNVPIRRLKQKAAAGADFVQTQLIFDIDGFREFMAVHCAEGLDRNLFLLAGIPVVVTQGALQMIPEIPGVHFPGAIASRLEQAKDLRSEGITLARELVERVREIPGVHGVHLMLFGTDHRVLNEVVRGMD